MKKIIFLIILGVFCSSCEQEIIQGENKETQTGEVKQDTPPKNPIKEEVGDKIQWTLEIKKLSDTEVQVVWPAKLLEKMKECTFKHWFGYGYTFEWGDGTEKDPKKSNCSTNHSYTVSGTYTIKATLWHPGPTDAPVTDWIGTQTVDITSSSSSKRPQVEVSNISSAEYDGIFYYQEFPNISWKTSGLDTKYFVEIQWITKSGKIITTPIKREVTFNGEWESHLWIWKDYDSAILGGDEEFFIKISLIDGTNTVVHSQTSQALKMSGELNPNTWLAKELIVNPLSGNSPLSVTVEKNVFHPDCHNYMIDWGDGSLIEKNTFTLHSGCGLESTNMKYSHTYSHPGNYTLIYKDNSHGPFKSAEQNAPFIKRNIQVN